MENFTSVSTDIFTGWFHNLSHVKSGNSAILDGNKILFYGIHSSGLIITFVSVIACISVIVSVIRNSKKDKWDFSDRFPLYLAISDLLWGISNFSGDHIILMITQVFPEKWKAELLAVNLSMFFGYQQLMNAGLCLYTYLRVVRRKSLNLGKWEWKLHLFCVTFLTSHISLFYYLGAYGNAGYWFLVDYDTKYGPLLSCQICISTTLHSFGTFMAYRAIKNVVGKQRRVVSMQAPVQPCYNVINGPQHYYGTANNCLTTFVYISLFLYIPLAIAAWCIAIENYFGVLDPVTAFIIAITANSGGWVNSIGYFHNKHIKDKRRLAIKSKALINSVSTSSTM